MAVKDKLMMAAAMVKYGVKMEDAVALYGKYVNNWGDEATEWRFDGLKNGEVVASVIRRPNTKLHLDVKVSPTELREGNSYDKAAGRIRGLDDFGNLVPYAQLPVKLCLTGAAELVGPDVVTAEGGMCGTYVRTIGQPGKAVLTVTTDQTEPVMVEFTVE